MRPWRGWDIRYGSTYRSDSGSMTLPEPTGRSRANELLRLYDRLDAHVDEHRGWRPALLVTTGLMLGVAIVFNDPFALGLVSLPALVYSILEFEAWKRKREFAEQIRALEEEGSGHWVTGSEQSCDEEFDHHSS